MFTAIRTFSQNVLEALAVHTTSTKALTAANTKATATLVEALAAHADAVKASQASLKAIQTAVQYLAAAEKHSREQNCQRHQF